MESTKRMRTAMSNEEDTASQGSAGGGMAASSGVAVAVAVAAAATETETEREEMAVVAAEEVGSAETEEHVQRILLAIENFTRQVSEMLEAGRALFKDLAADFEDRLCSIHKERVDRWEEEIRELRARDAAEEQARAFLHDAQLHLLHTVRH